MRSIKVNDDYIVRLSKGEKIVKTLEEFIEKKDIRFGYLSGIGSAREIELGYYDLDKKKYYWKKFEDVHEITNMTGNISQVKGKAFLHIHLTISDKSFDAFGGHLKEAIVGATCEIVLRPSDIFIEREMDTDVGLKLLDLPQE